MRVLVTGGAGYIGSHATRTLVEAGHDVTVLDDFSTGHRDAVHPGATLVEGGLADPRAVDRALTDREAVLHFAASSIVSESCRDPLKYWSNNVGGTVSLLMGMRRAGVPRLIFSSTAATYGIPDVMPIREDAPQKPINPYGSSKLAIEQVVHDLADAWDAFGFAILRYFNVAGCLGGLGERHDPETHLVPIILQTALGMREAISIFGTDYPTPDGTCVRDYVHVQDLVDAHAEVLAQLTAGDRRIYNIGSGRGWSVREVIQTAKRVTGVDFTVREAPRRAGDPPTLVTTPEKISHEIGWSTRRSDLEQILSDHWAWMRSAHG